MSYQSHFMLHLARHPKLTAGYDEHRKPQRRNPPDKAKLRANLETMRQSFHDLLNTLTEADWNRKAPAVSAFSVGGLLTHCLMAVSVIPQELASIRQGRNFYHLPSWLMKLLRLGSARWAARVETRASVGRKLDRAVDEVLQALETVQADEWQQGAYMYDEGFWTVEKVFTQQPHHFAEHAATVRQILQDGYVTAT
jgi:hypothetical protein